jgi:hypothetical protein
MHSYGLADLSIIATLHLLRHLLNSKYTCTQIVELRKIMACHFRSLHSMRIFNIRIKIATDWVLICVFHERSWTMYDRQSDSNEENDFTEHHQAELTWTTGKGVLVGALIGCLLCFSNTYFGLQTGWITMGSLQSALLGYGFLKLLVSTPSIVPTTLFAKLSFLRPAPFGPKENHLLRYSLRRLLSLRLRCPLPEALWV